MDWGSIFENTLRQLFGVDTAFYAIAAIGLNVQFGYGGLLNFGHAGFMAAGAYGMGMTALYFHVSPWFGIVFAVVFAIVLGLLMGVPTLRLRADYLAIVTIAAAEVIRLIVRSVRFKKYFGGSDGINSFADQFYRADWPIIGSINNGARYGFGPWEYQGRTLRIMVVAWFLVAVFGVFVFLLMRSPWGRVLRGIREDEDAVRSLGKNVFSYKMQALVIGGVIGSIAGLVFAISRGSVQPDNYSRDVTFYVMTALVLGGIATVSGSIVGPMMFWMALAFADSFLNQLFLTYGKIEIFGAGIITQTSDVGPIRLALVGGTLMLLMIYRPQGVFGNPKELSLDAR